MEAVFSGSCLTRSSRSGMIPSSYSPPTKKSGSGAFRIKVHGHALKVCFSGVADYCVVERSREDAVAS